MKTFYKVNVFVTLKSHSGMWLTSKWARKISNRAIDIQTRPHLVKRLNATGMFIGRRKVTL